MEFGAKGSFRSICFSRVCPEPVLATRRFDLQKLTRRRLFLREPRAFFDAADEFGILIYEDAQFTFGEVGFEPHLHDDQLQAELAYQVNRLAHHPSVVLYTGCNECIYHDGGGQYEGLVTTRIAAVDPSRIIWPHSPAPGLRHQDLGPLLTLKRIIVPRQARDKHSLGINSQKDPFSDRRLGEWHRPSHHETAARAASSSRHQTRWRRSSDRISFSDGRPRSVRHNW